MKDTKVIFMGTPEFSLPTLQALHRAFTVILVVTQPDRPSGRGLQVTPPPVKIKAEELGLPVLQPKTMRDSAIIEKLREAAPDYIITAAYGRLLPPAVLSIPKKKPLNIHASLLPKYRGAAPIQHAVMNGEKKTGVTVIEMDEGMDTGDIILQEAITVGEDETAGSVHDRLSVLGAGLIVRAVELINSDKCKKIKQQEFMATYAPPISKAETKIDWSAPAKKIHDQVRGLIPYPGAYTILNGKRVKILGGRPHTGGGSPFGTVLKADNAGIVVAAGDGTYRIETLQAAGKRIMTVREYLCGNPIQPGTICS